MFTEEGDLSLPPVPTYPRLRQRTLSQFELAWSNNPILASSDHLMHFLPRFLPLSDQEFPGCSRIAEK